MAVRALARPPRSAPGPLLPEHDKYVGGPVGVGTLGGWQSHCFRFAFSGTRIEYIIRALTLVDSRCRAGGKGIVSDLLFPGDVSSISFAHYPLWVRVGCRTLWCLRVRFLTFLRFVSFSYAQSFAALLRTRRPSFCHLQLLSAPAVSWNAARAEPFCEGPGPGPFAIHISALTLHVRPPNLPSQKRQPDGKAVFLPRPKAS